MSGVVSSLIARSVRVYSLCQECRATRDVDLQRVLAAKGPDYDLTDKTAACRTGGCTYWVSFYAQEGQRNWPLRTEAGLMKDGRRRTVWLAERRG